MQPQRRKELCVSIAVFALCIACTAAMLTSATGSESLELLCFAITSLVFSWLLSANEKVRSERRAVSLSTTSAAHSVSSISSHQSSSVAAPKTKQTAVVNAFSIDLEDYFHTEVATKTTAWSDWDHLPSRLENTVPRLLDLLDETDSRATVFVLGWVAEKYPTLVRQVASRGHEIACHSYRHRAVFKMEPKSFYEDTRKAKQITEDATGCILTGFRAPCFSITKGTEWAFDILSELGFRYDSSVNPIHHGFYGNPRSPHIPHYVGDSGLWEIPIAVWRMGGLNFPIGGGAYLRLLPYAYSVAGLRYLNRVEKRSATIYMHPWELDSEQPDLRLPLLSRIRQTQGTSAMERRVRGMLEEFQFAPLGEVYSQWLIPSESTSTMTARSLGVAVEALS
jgi:polysaccharide deacetylase family protein (PEP-CTERM system associated)